jgi:hypothetical protein
MRQDATLRKLEVIGQAVKNLSERTKSREPEIPWKQIAGMRLSGATSLSDNFVESVEDSGEFFFGGAGDALANSID